MHLSYLVRHACSTLRRYAHQLHLSYVVKQQMGQREAAQQRVVNPPLNSTEQYAAASIITTPTAVLPP